MDHGFVMTAERLDRTEEVNSAYSKVLEYSLKCSGFNIMTGFLSAGASTNVVIVGTTLLPLSEESVELLEARAIENDKSCWIYIRDSKAWMHGPTSFTLLGDWVGYSLDDKHPENKTGLVIPSRNVWFYIM